MYSHPSFVHLCGLTNSYSDLCTPVGELNRLTLLHSSPWESKAESLKKIRSDYESMQRKLNIALKKLEMMAAEVRGVGLILLCAK